MSTVSRSDMYMKSESGGEWFDEFLRLYASGGNATSVSDIVSVISNKNAETVDSIVKKYREQAGLDIIANEASDNDNIKTAARSELCLSIRQANIKSDKNVLLIIKQDPSILKAIDSMCEHSGGNKNTHAIINYLRDKLGHDLVSYTDNDLINYIEEVKDKYKDVNIKEDNAVDVGLLGADKNESFEDNVADYITHGKPGG